MTKSQLIETVTSRIQNVSKKDVELVVETIFGCMTDALAKDERIEIRGLGSFVAKTRDAREGRNPKTGEKVTVPRKRTPFFTVGKELKERVNVKRAARA
ncbi:MAG: integration host factor subunit beta [Myxococcales bacterium]|nr:integration host factor subunit beta [Myxococcales bacterium]